MVEMNKREGVGDKADLNNLRMINEMLPEVRTTRMDIERFDSRKIINSLIRETGVNQPTGEQVTRTVLQRIIQSNVQWLSGPQIREMCCSVLGELGMTEARRRYTRIGMPLMDYEALLTQGIKENANQYNNPESIHSWAADKISAEYTLLRLLTEEQSKAHLVGDLHVHMLRYFDLRPFCAEWDLRMILKHGLPPAGWRHSAVSSPANHAMVAILHAAKWLGIVQGEFSGGQGFDNFTVFIAPYLKRSGNYEEKHKEAKQLAQCFLYETNQIYAARGAQVPFTSISCIPTIPDELRDVPAVSFGGKYDGVYGDYDDECKLFFRALSEMYCKGDGTGKLFNFPKHEVKLKKEWLTKFEDEYLLVSKEAAKFGTPYYLNMCADWMPAEVHSQCCRIILVKGELQKLCNDPDLFDWHKSFINIGSLQSISLNLPRYAYQARGDDDRLFEIIDKNMEIARQILFIKQQVIERALKNNLIPICGSKVEGQQLLDFRKQALSIGYVGLNECMLAHTGKELHESSDTFEFGKKVIQHLVDKCDEFTLDSRVKFSLWQQPAESTAERFAKLDLIHYPNEAIPLGDRATKSVYYTNSDHLNYAADVSLFERIDRQAEFHPIVKGGVITHIWLGEAYPNPEGLWKFTKAIAEGTPTAYFAFTKDFTQCLKCLKFINGIYSTCPHCGAGDEYIEWWSRVTGYYSRVKQYNKGKVQEWHDRKRYNL